MAEPGKAWIVSQPQCSVPFRASIWVAGQMFFENCSRVRGHRAEHQTPEVTAALTHSDVPDQRWSSIKADKKCNADQQWEKQKERKCSKRYVECPLKRQLHVTTGGSGQRVFCIRGRVLRPAWVNSWRQGPTAERNRTSGRVSLNES